MCESISQLDAGVEKVCHAFHALQEKGTEIIMILGNHEIPIVGPYETGPASLTAENFRERLDNLKLKLSNTRHIQAILPKIKFGQYALIEKTENSWEVQTYDSISQVQVNPASECHALVAHGFQFDRTSPEHSETWKYAIDVPDSLKDVMDFFFNGAIRAIRNVVSPSKWDAGPEAVKNAIQTHKNLKKQSAESTSLIQMIDEHPTQVQKFSHEYLQTITKRNYGLSTIFQDLRTLLNNNLNLHGISHVLFGHTHEVQVVEDLGKATIINTGAWQHVRKMTYIELNNGGSFSIKHIRSKTYMLYMLLGLSLAAGIVLCILGIIFIPP